MKPRTGWRPPTDSERAIDAENERGREGVRVYEQPIVPQPPEIWKPRMACKGWDGSGIGPSKFGWGFWSNANTGRALPDQGEGGGSMLSRWECDEVFLVWQGRAPCEMMLTVRPWWLPDKRKWVWRYEIHDLPAGDGGDAPGES